MRRLRAALELLGEEPGEQVQRAERVAHLVGDAGEQGLALLVARAERPAHLLERVAQRADLVAPRPPPERRLEIAARDAPRRLGEPRERPRDGERRERGDERAEHRAGDGDRAEEPPEPAQRRERRRRPVRADDRDDRPVLGDERRVAGLVEPARPSPRTAPGSRTARPCAASAISNRSRSSAWTGSPMGMRPSESTSAVRSGRTTNRRVPVARATGKSRARTWP